jgi:hypothetical protein
MQRGCNNSVCWRKNVASYIYLSIDNVLLASEKVIIEWRRKAEIGKNGLTLRALSVLASAIPKQFCALSVKGRITTVLFPISNWLAEKMSTFEDIVKLCCLHVMYHAFWPIRPWKKPSIEVCENSRTSLKNVRSIMAWHFLVVEFSK